MSGIQQMLTGGTYMPAPPTTIGQAYGGGYYAGKIAVGGGGVATHYLIVAPKASGESSGLYWGPLGVSSGFTSLINGPTNSAGEAALGGGYQAATFCEGLTIGGYSDWYLPALNELEVLYYFLKPSTTANNTSYGSNANAVSPEPISTNYTSGSPAQTNATEFKYGASEALRFNDGYWSSSEYGLYQSWVIYTNAGIQSNDSKNGTTQYVRAVRRVPV